MAKLKNKFIFSFFIVSGFIIYSISTNFQKISRLFGENDGEQSTANLLTNPNNVALDTSPNAPPAAGVRGQGKMMSKLGKYRDGEYSGNSVDAYYGYVKVKAIIKNGLISDIQFLEYPNDRGTSIQISNTSLPLLKTEAISAQSAQIDMVSGATETSRGFIQSLASALQQA